MNKVGIFIPNTKIITLTNNQIRPFVFREEKKLNNKMS